MYIFVYLTDCIYVMILYIERESIYDVYVCVAKAQLHKVHCS